MSKLIACFCLVLFGALHAQSQIATETRTFLAPPTNVQFTQTAPGTFNLPSVNPWSVSIPRYDGPRIVTGVRLKLDLQVRWALQAAFTQPNTSLYTNEYVQVHPVLPLGALPGTSYSSSKSYSFTSGSSLTWAATTAWSTQSTGFQQLSADNMLLFQGQGDLDIAFGGAFTASGSVPFGGMTAVYGYQGTKLTVTAEYTTEAPSSVYGMGCVGAGNLVPQIGLVGTASISGVPFDITLQDAAPNSVAMLALSSGRSQIPLTGGCTFLLGSDFVAADVFLTQADGSWATQLELPNVPGLVGQYFYAQEFVFDAEGAHEGWLTLSAGLGVLMGG